MLLATIRKSLVDSGGTFNLAFLGFPPQCVRFRAPLARDGQIGTYWQQPFVRLASLSLCKGPADTASFKHAAPNNKVQTDWPGAGLKGPPHPVTAVEYFRRRAYRLRGVLWSTNAQVKAV